MITTGRIYDDDDSDDDDFVDNTIKMKIDPNPGLLTHWSDCPVKLPSKLTYHSSVVSNNRLYVTGGCIRSY